MLLLFISFVKKNKENKVVLEKDCLFSPDTSELSHLLYVLIDMDN